MLQLAKSLFLIVFLVISATCPVHAETISAEELENQIDQKIAEVPEFSFIIEEAKKAGIRVWLFGGTAASFAHYAKWDLLRQKGDPRFQPDRFDYDYTNIYRSNQDLDIVIDGSEAQAKELQGLLAKRYPHLQGNKSAWEVRLLRQTMGEKEALLDNPEFSNQHTDSHSVGMVELTDGGEDRIRDLRAWNEKRPAFLRDVLAGRLHYYFSNFHSQTKRAQAGKNPPILSVVRFYIKAFQFELDIAADDYDRLKSIIEAFHPRTLTAYERQWLEKNVPKLIQNAVSIEYAWNVLEKNGLRRKLIVALGDAGVRNTAAWWLNREPLRGETVGRGDGATARSLRISIVAHETTTFEAYESITRAHTGEPNVLVSRPGVDGEMAAHGKGFYTRTGTKGARGTDITIRFKVDPEAREGTDFKRIGDFVIFHNKSSLKVIPESLNFGLLDYFKFLAKSDIPGDERAMLEKLRRRLKGRMASDVTDEQIAEIEEIILKKKRGKLDPELVGEYLRLGIYNRSSISNARLVALLSSLDDPEKLKAVLDESRDFLRARKLTYRQFVVILDKLSAMTDRERGSLAGLFDIPYPTDADLEWLTDEIRKGRASDYNAVEEWFEKLGTSIADHFDVIENQKLEIALDRWLFAKRDRKLQMPAAKLYPLLKVGGFRHVGGEPINLFDFVEVSFAPSDERWIKKEALTHDPLPVLADWAISYFGSRVEFSKEEMLKLAPRLIFNRDAGHRIPLVVQTLERTGAGIREYYESVLRPLYESSGVVTDRNNYNSLLALDRFVRPLDGDLEWMRKNVLQSAPSRSGHYPLAPYWFRYDKQDVERSMEKLEVMFGSGISFSAIEAFVIEFKGVPDWAARSEVVRDGLTKYFNRENVTIQFFKNNRYHENPEMVRSLVPYTNSRYMLNILGFSDLYANHLDSLLYLVEKVHSEYSTDRKSGYVSPRAKMMMEAAEYALSAQHWKTNQQIRALLNLNPLHERLLTPANLSKAIALERSRIARGSTPTVPASSFKRRFFAPKTCEGAFQR